MIGERLKCLRKASGLTQEELGRALEINPLTLKSYENDKREPGLETIVKIAQFFGVSTDHLLGCKEISEDEEPIIGLTAGLSPEEKKKVIELVKTAVKIYGTEDTKK